VIFDTAFTNQLDSTRYQKKLLSAL